MSVLWTAAEAAAATGGHAGGDWSAEGVSIDTRTVAPGDLFIALQGPNFDGHLFVADALARGAAAALVSRVPDNVAENAPLLLTGDTLEALTALGAAARLRSAATFIGVTGSVGKTGIKEALRQALEPLGPVMASAGSLNNHWGVPLTLARMPRDLAFGVVEMGMNHAGELGPLSRIARPDVALITTIEPAHIGNFASVEEIADAKAEIFEGLEDGGAVILNRDNPYFPRLAKAASRRGIDRIIGFGVDEAAEARLLDCRLLPSSSAVTASILGEEITYSVGIPGEHWVLNSLAVLAAVAAAGGDILEAARALGRLQALAGRGRRHLVRGITLFDESYNASPASMRAAIGVLGAANLGSGGRRIAVLGAMLELGAESARLHAELSEPLQEADVDLVFTVGPEMEALQAVLPETMRGAHTATAAEMAALLPKILRSGDAVTVKGSNGSRMAVIVEQLLSDPDAPASRVLLD